MHVTFRLGEYNGFYACWKWASSDGLELFSVLDLRERAFDTKESPMVQAEVGQDNEWQKEHVLIVNELEREWKPYMNVWEKSMAINQREEMKL